jgi:hypothetical protein
MAQSLRQTTQADQEWDLLKANPARFSGAATICRCRAGPMRGTCPRSMSGRYRDG